MTISKLTIVTSIVLAIATANGYSYAMTKFNIANKIYQQQSECVNELIQSGIERNRIQVFTHLNVGECSIK